MLKALQRLHGPPHLVQAALSGVEVPSESGPVPLDPYSPCSAPDICPLSWCPQSSISCICPVLVPPVTLAGFLPGAPASSPQSANFDPGSRSSSFPASSTKPTKAAAQCQVKAQSDRPGFEPQLLAHWVTVNNFPNLPIWKITMMVPASGTGLETKGCAGKHAPSTVVGTQLKLYRKCNVSFYWTF